MDALDRLTPDYLERAESDLQRIRDSLRGHIRNRKYVEKRAVIHCHSALSHDSRGSIREMVEAAKATGTEVVMVTDHIREDLDVIAEGCSGRRSGILFIPGAEVKNLLLFFSPGLDFSRSQRDLISDARAAGGMVFLSHLEGQKEWDLQGLHGTEIYNLHASFKGQKRLSALFNPRSLPDLVKLLETLLLLDSHPEVGFATLCEIPHEYLSRWDWLSARSDTTGIAANDSHANNSVTIRRDRTGGLEIKDFRGSTVARIPASSLPRLTIPGDELLLTPDSYEISFGHVGTHLLLDGLGEDGLKDCLSKGRCYVAFDWIASPRGFDFSWETSKDGGTMGDKISLNDEPVLLAQLPTQAELVLKREGEVVESLRSISLEHRPTSTGKYRLEAYLNVAGEMRPWIYSNPIQVCR